jgi:hypothetical protein
MTHGRAGADLSPMRRLLSLALAGLVFVTTGCSGRDAEEAQTLLAESEAAVAQVRSVSFTGKFWTEGGPQELSFTIAGGAYAKGKQAGDFYVVVRSKEEGLFEDMILVQRDGRMSASVGGSLLAGGLPSTSPERSPGFLELEPYVKDVEVEHGRLVGGESATKITGVVDTAALVEGSLASIPELAGLSEGGFDMAGALGDTRAVIYISDATHLPLRALLDLPIDILGEEIVLHVDYAYTSFDEKLSFPDLR